LSHNSTSNLNYYKVDKSPGPDGLHPRVLKEIQSYIVEILKIIFWFIN